MCDQRGRLLGPLPSPLVGGGWGGGVVRLGNSIAVSHDPHPQPLPTRAGQSHMRDCGSCARSSRRVTFSIGSGAGRPPSQHATPTGSSFKRSIAHGRPKISAKNTMDLQCECDADYNARPCAGEEKAAGAGTMENNGKNNAQSNRNSRKCGRVPTPGWTPEDRRRRCARVVAKLGYDGSAWHCRDVPEAMKMPADEQRRATVAQIRD